MLDPHLVIGEPQWTHPVKLECKTNTQHPALTSKDCLLEGIYVRLPNARRT